MQVSIPEFKHSNMLRTIDEVVEHLISLFQKESGLWTMDKIYIL